MFVLFGVQTLLVASGRVALHRQLGIAAAIVAAGVVVTSLITLAQLVPSWRANGIDVDAQRPLLGLRIWGDLGALAAYVVFLTRGLLLRRRPDAHRRLMLLASLSIISPALIRLADLPVFAGIDGVLVTLLGLLAFAAVLGLHDLLTLAPGASRNLVGHAVLPDRAPRPRLRGAGHRAGRLAAGAGLVVRAVDSEVSRDIRTSIMAAGVHGRLHPHASGAQS